MSALNCDGICQTALSGIALLNVRTASEFNNGALPDAKTFHWLCCHYLPMSILIKMNPYRFTAAQVAVRLWLKKYFKRLVLPMPSKLAAYSTASAVTKVIYSS